MKTKVLASLALLTSLNSATIYADDSMEADLGGFGEENLEALSDDLGGFGEENIEVIQEEQTVTSKPSMFRVSGNVAFKTSLGYKSHRVYSVEYFRF